LDSIFLSTCESLDADDRDDDKGLKLTYSGADGKTTERMVTIKPCNDAHLGTPLVPPAPTLRLPKPDFLVSREGSTFEAHSQEHRVEEQGNHSPTIQIYRNHTEYPPSSAPSSNQCLALTDEQCRRIQELVDPDGIRNQKDWETKLQPQLIRLYMTGKSFPLIEFEMKKLSGLSWT